MKRFEYHIFKLETSGWFSSGKVDTTIIDQRINEFGGKGWELVSAFDTSRHEGATQDVIMIFKREKSD